MSDGIDGEIARRARHGFGVDGVARSLYFFLLERLWYHVRRPGWKRRTVPVHAYMLIYRTGNTTTMVYKILRDLHGNYRIQSQQRIVDRYKSITVNIIR